MKLLRLDLLAYGPFTRQSLDFGDGGPNLHIIYGPNEAGKSTTLRAIAGLFYGIETQTGDAHRHAMADLRIGATLKHSSGEERLLVRKKGRGGTLLDAKGNAVDESTLRAWMSIPERKHFEQMFGLSHDQLRAAGAALADPKTDVGRMLFGASLDGTTLQQTLVKLEEEADRLLTARGGAISKALASYREQQSKAKDLALPQKEWLALEGDIERIAGEQRRVSEEIVGVRTQRHRFERLQRALPWLRQREDALRARVELGEQRRLEAAVEGQRREIANALDAATDRMRRVEADVAQLRAGRDGLVVAPELLAAGARIKTLTEELGKYKAELRDQPGIQKEIIGLRGEQREHLRRIGFDDVDPRASASVRVDDATLARIHSLQQEGVTIETRRKELAEQIDARRFALSQSEATLVSLPPRVDTALLRATWEQLRPDKGLTTAIQEAEIEVAALDERAGMECAALVPWQGTPDAAPLLPVPSEEVLRGFDEDFANDRRVTRELGERLVAQTTELEGIRRERSALELHGEPPTQERLNAARMDRDRLWERLREDWRTGKSPETPEAEGTTSLASAFVSAMRAADELADGLRRESGRAAQYALLRHKENEAERAVERGREALSTREPDTRRLNEAWTRVWSPCGFAPASPREMLGWRGRHAQLVATMRQLHEATARLQALQRKQREQRATLVSALDAAGTAIPDTMTWLSLLLLVERTIAGAAERDAFRASLEQRLQSGRQDLAAVEARLASYDADRDAWQAQWGTAVARLRLPPDARPEQADVVIAGLRELSRIEVNCERQEARLKALAKQALIFQEHLDALQAEFAPDLSGQPIERADALIARYAEATTTEARRRTLDEQLRKQEHDLAEARRAVDHEQRRLNALLGSAGCRDLDELDGAIARSSRARELDAQVADAEKSLNAVGEGWTLQSLEAAARETDSDRIETEIAALDERLKTLEVDQRQQTESLGGLRERQSKFSGKDDAANALAEAQGHLAQARAHAERYARLRLATAVLRRGIESYRQKNQGTILSRASRLLECLTLGRYQRLAVEYEGERAKLVCVRDGEPVDVKGALSDGTLDQLYLSLRLASLEEHLEAQEPMPLVLDDIFIHFDDDRARAGLRVIADLSAKTQVILLTHHARNLDLARAELSPATWKEHHLPSPIGAGDA